MAHLDCPDDFAFGGDGDLLLFKVVAGGEKASDGRRSPICGLVSY